MNTIIRKFKKLNKTYQILFICAIVLNIIGISFITQGLLILNNIETVLRIIFLILIYLGFFTYLFISILLLFTKKNKVFLTLTTIGIIINIAFIIISIYINKTYNTLNNMNKDTILYSTSLIVKNETNFKNNKKFKVGMINNEEDIEGNYLANQLIDNKRLDKITIEYYNNYLEMLGDLYNDKINGLFISTNYPLTYKNYENYTNIENETKIIYSYEKEMKNQDLVLSSNKKLTEPFTILLLGVDSAKNGLNENTIFNGDTMMMITFNPKTLNATVFSIPRDTYVPISCYGGNSNKINSSAVGGTSCVINTLENLTDIDIDYYVKINFKGVVELVDALNGIEVDVPIEFCEQDSNREFGENEICLDKGEQTLNGEEALALSRHRKTLVSGDFQRVEHQQLIVEAIAKKAKTIRSVDTLYDILNAISNNIETNIKTSEMLNLYNVGKNILFKNNANINLQKTFLTGYDLTMLIPGLGNVYTFQYYEESLNEIIKAMKINLEQEEPELIKTFNFSVNYNYEVPVIGKEYYSVKRNETIPNFVDSSISYLENWANSRNITINKNYITEGMDGYNENKDGIITYQDVPNGTLVSTISTININVIKVEEKIIEETENKEETIEKNNETDKEINKEIIQDEILDDITNIN